MSVQNGTSSAPSERLFVTHLEAIGPYLKIYGQTNTEAMGIVRARVKHMLPACIAIDPNWKLERQQQYLKPGAICLYKRINPAATNVVEFLRVSILKIYPQGSSLMVDVDFIDYGDKITLASYELLIPEQDDSFQKLPARCSHYILLGIFKDWKQSELLDIAQMIKYQTLDFKVAMEFKHFKFITMDWKEFNLAEFLIHHKKIGAPILNDLLRDDFTKILEQSQLEQEKQKPQPQHRLPSTEVGKDSAIFAGKNKNNTTNNNNYYTSNKVTPPTNFMSSNVPNTTQMEMGAAAASQSSVQSRLHRFNMFDQSEIAMQPHRASLRMRNVQPFPLPDYLAYVPRFGRYNIGKPMPHMYSLRSYNVGMHPVTLSPNNYRLFHPVQPQQQPVARNASKTVEQSTSEKSPGVRQNDATFISNKLESGKCYDVCVSYVENGPCLFSVQLTATQNELTKMMTRIERVSLKNLTAKPELGTACISRYSEDGQLYRALITGIQLTQCKVVYVDYGNTELVSYKDLYEIPDEFLQAKTYAIRLTLAGLKELAPIDDSLRKQFKDLVMYKNCKLKVMPYEGPSLFLYCELFMQDKNMLDILKDIQKTRLVYPKPESLKNSDIVEIRYIDSPKSFYVQNIKNIEVFEQLMDDMFMYYNKNQVVPTNLPLGAPCIVKYENEWFRAEVMRADASAIIVRHVDFGYEQKVTKNLLSNVAEKHLKLPRQAVHCCLKGFENNELNKDLATVQFEMLAEESNRKRRSFTVKVYRINPDGQHLVNLATKELNVMKKLYKLSMSFEEYLSLEKEDFNMNNHNNNQLKSESTKKTSSIGSSTEAKQLHSNRKSNNIEQKETQNDETLPRQQQLKSQVLKRHNEKDSKSQTSHTSECDKSSSVSSMDNRDSRSNSSEHKKRSKRNSQHQRQDKNLQLNTSSDSYKSISPSKTQSSLPNNMSKATSPRSQNTSRDSDNQRHNKDQKQNIPANQRNQRPRNAPKGYVPQITKNSSRLSDTGSVKSLSNDNGIAHATEKKRPEAYVPLNVAFPIENISTPSQEEVILCYWISPHQFYTQLKSRVPDYEALLRDMQNFYETKPLQQLQLKVGSNVIVRNRRDNSLNRARILACNQMLRKYKVFFVDIGSETTVTSEDIWQVEERFASLPCMAYMCSFKGVISNYDNLYIIDQIEKYLPNDVSFLCEYMERHKNFYFANIKVNKKTSLKDTLIKDGLISAVDPDFSVELLAGQQIRAKISSIKDMLNFKIQIDGCDSDIKLLCCYDDIKYVKSNPDIAQKFKMFYEGKSCAVNIKSVNDIKVVSLRPMLPLLHNEINNYFCNYPIIMKTFTVNVVFVSSIYRVFAHLKNTGDAIAALLNDMYEYYEQTDVAPLKRLEADQICAAKSTSDDNWYRARIVGPYAATNDTIQVRYLDYGNTEGIPSKQIKPLVDQFCKLKSIYAIEINLPLRPNEPDKKNQMVEELNKLTIDKPLTVKVIEMRRNHLIADLITTDNKSIVDLLQSKRFIKGRDLEHIRGVIDGEKANVMEYIETIDLTLENEEDNEKKSGKMSICSSPKRKQQPVKNEAKAKNVQEIPATVPQIQEVTQLEPIKPIETTVPVPVAHTNEKTTTNAGSATSPPTAPTKEVTTEVISKSPVTMVTEPASELQESEVDPYADMECGVLSHCDNPTQFFVHLQDKVEELRKLQENLQIVATSLPPLVSVYNGVQCISLYSVDKQWYRAKIMDAELMVLKFIDYGNTDCVSDTTDIKVMDVFPNIEPFCIPCALPIKPKGTTDWVDAANSIFNDSYSKVLRFEYITRGDQEKRSYINLYIDGINVSEKLIQDGFAKPMELIHSGENCFISHVNGITDFWIQYERDSKVLELIELYLSDIKQLQPIKKFEHSKIVAAIFPDDNSWYRAKLLKEIPSQGYEVLFIDYGNTAISPEIREISESIAPIPPMSKRCALELPATCTAWSDAAEEKFAVISQLGETVFTVELREPSADHALVHLLIDGHNINDDLEPFCERKARDVDLNSSFGNTTLQTSICEGESLYSATVCEILSPSDFYIQFEKDAVRIEDLNNTLNTLTMSTVTQAQVGQMCAIAFKNQGYYRGEILQIIAGRKEQYRVKLIDYGTEITTDDIKTLPQDLQELRPFGVQCQLEYTNKLLPFEANATPAFMKLLADCNNTVRVEVVNKGCSPIIIKLWAADTGEDIFDNLYKKLLQSSINPTAVQIRSQELESLKCVISHAASPTHFYIQKLQNAPQVEFVEKALIEFGKYEPKSPVHNAILGDVVVAYAEDDKRYWRGRVTCVLESNLGYEIFLLDYGNTIITKQIFELPEALQTLSALALKCRLNDVPTNVTDTLLEEQFTALVDAHFGEFYELEIVETNKSTSEHTVKLQIDYKDLAEELALAVKCQNKQADAISPHPTLYDCYVVHVNAPNSFYIQLSSDIDATKVITEKLFNAEEKCEPLYVPSVGDICAAQFPEDMAYYRAQIVDVVDDNKYLVHFIDFGNDSVAEKFYQLPEDMLLEPPYSKHCTFDINFKSEDAEEEFRTWIDAHYSETFQVEFLRATKEPIICRLFYQERNVANELRRLLAGNNNNNNNNNESKSETLKKWWGTALHKPTNAGDESGYVGGNDPLSPSATALY